MSSTGQSNSIADDVRTVRLDGTDMGGSDFSASAAIDQLEPCHCATLIISTQDNTTEYSIPYGTRCEKRQPFAVLLEYEGRLFLGKTGDRVILVETRQQRVVLVEPQGKNVLEVRGRNRSNRRLGPTGDASRLV